MKTAAVVDSGRSLQPGAARAGTCTAAIASGPWALLASNPGGAWRPVDALGATALLAAICWVGQLLAS